MLRFSFYWKLINRSGYNHQLRISKAFGHIFPPNECFLCSFLQPKVIVQQFFRNLQYFPITRGITCIAVSASTLSSIIVLNACRVEFSRFQIFRSWISTTLLVSLLKFHYLSPFQNSVKFYITTFPVNSKPAANPNFKNVSLSYYYAFTYAIFVLKARTVIESTHNMI